jgi:hypothetical protein
MIQSADVARCATELRSLHRRQVWSWRGLLAFACLCDDLVRDEDVALIGACTSAFHMLDHELVIALALLREYMRAVPPEQVCFRRAWIGCALVACKVHDDHETAFYDSGVALLHTTRGYLWRCELNVLMALRWKLPLASSEYAFAYSQLKAKPSADFWNFFRGVLL